MILIINPTQNNQFFLTLVKDNKKLKVFCKTLKFYQGETLLSFIDNFFKKYKIKPQGLKGIIVVLGPGSFTLLRTSAVIANTLGFSLKIPVVGIKITEFQNIENLIKIGLKKLSQAKVGEFVEPFYGKAPHITKPKRKGPI